MSLKQNFQDMPRNLPEVSSDRCLSCASKERSRSAEQSSASYSGAETSSIDLPKNVVSPIESKLSLKTGYLYFVQNNAILSIIESFNDVAFVTYVL